jgi:hypothetical protein
MPTALPALTASLPAMLASAPETVLLPSAIRRLLPSISWLAEESVVQYRDDFLAVADRLADALAEVGAMERGANPAEVVMFLAAVAERRGFALPPPAMLAMDARAVAEEIPADLLPLACKRLWGRFAYRRLPEPSDFAKTVEDELRERREAAAKVHTVALKVKTAQMQARWQREAAERHAASRAHERALAGAARTAPDGGERIPPPLRQPRRSLR